MNHTSVTPLRLIKTLSYSVLLLASSLGIGCSSSDNTTNPAQPDAGGDATDSASSQTALVGSPCTKNSDCGADPFFCQVEHPGGYCMHACDIANGDSDCPNEAICQFDGTVGECHKKCAAPTDCRTNYSCSPASTASDNKASHAFCDADDMNMDSGTTDSAMDGSMDGAMNTDSAMSMDSAMDSAMSMDSAMDSAMSMDSAMDSGMSMDSAMAPDGM